jgi:OmpA-OmpF porin, OOP family
VPKGGRDLYVMLYTSTAANASTNMAATYLEIVEPKAMQTGQVTVDASAMKGGLQADGKVALYGLYFDTGKADVKPESKAQREEVPKLLQTQPALKVYIVGHTPTTWALWMPTWHCHNSVRRRWWRRWPGRTK